MRGVSKRSIELLSVLTSAIGLIATLAILTSKKTNADANNLLEIYEYYDHLKLDAIPPDVHPLVLQLPESLRYGSTAGSTRNWGANILTYYPTFSSPSDLNNSNFGLACTGYCNGRILISINYRPHSLNNPHGSLYGTNAPNMADYIGRNDIASILQISGDQVTSKLAGTTAAAIGPQLGFDKGYEVYYPASGGAYSSTRKLLLRFAPDHFHYDLIADCEANEHARTCSLHFSMNCDPAIYVQVGPVDIDHVTDLADVENKTDAFVASMVRSETCH